MVYRPLIDGTYAARTQAPTTTTRTTSTTTTRTTTLASPRVTRTAPKIYYFQGKAYTSLSAYNSAVAAAKARADAQARATLEARARIEAERRQAALRAEQQRRADAYRAEAMRAARRAAEREISKRAASKMAAQVRRQKVVAEARKRAVSQELLRPQAQARDWGRERLLAQQRELRLTQEQREAVARTRAYEELKRISRRAFEGNLLGEDRAAIRPEEQRRLMVQKAETSGNWQMVINELSRQSRASGGAFIDSQLMQTLQERYVAPIQSIRDEMAVLVAEMNRLERADDMDALLELVEDPQNIALYRKFVELFGDGTRPGTFTPVQQVLEDISSARERAWAIQLGMGARWSSPEQARQLVQQAERESRGRLAGTGLRRGEQFVDRTFTTQMLNPETGRMESVTLRGLDAWLAREQAREADRVQGVWQARQNELARWNQHLDGQAEGRITMQTVRSWMPEWQFNEQGVPARIAAAAGNPGNQEHLIREFMADASNAYDRNMGWYRSALAPRGIDVGGAVEGQRYMRAKQAWLRSLAAQLGKPEWGWLDQQSTTLLGGAGQIALTAMSVFPALIRDRLQQDFGALQPHLEVPLPWDPGSRFDVGFRPDPNAEEAHQNLQNAGGTGDFWADLGAWGSVIRDNSMWGSGNIGGAFTQLTDPFLLAGPGRVIQAGKLASARAGGFAGVFSGNAGVLAREFARYTAPEFMRGAGRATVKIELAKVELARGFGLSGTDALRMGDDEFREFIEHARLDRTDQLLKSDILDRLARASGIEKTQVLNMVQEMAPDILRKYGIFSEDPFEAAARIREIRRAATRARSEAESAAQLARMQAERTAAMEALSRVTGRPLEAAKVTPAQLSRHEQLVTDYAEAAKEYLSVAERGVKAADQLESGTITDARRIRGLQAQLRTAVADLKRLEDEYVVRPHGRKELSRRGLVGQRFDRLRQYRERYGGDPTAPSFVDQSWRQIRYDEKRVKSLIKQTLAQLKATPLNQTLSGTLKAQLRELELARRGLVYERALLDDGRTLMRPYVKRQSARIQKSVTPQRVAPLAANEATLHRGIGQDFMRALDDVQVRQPVRVSEAKMTAFRQGLDQAVDVRAIMGPHAQRMIEALGREPTLRELWLALYMASGDKVWRAELIGQIRRVNAMVYDAGRQAGINLSGLNRREAADRLFEIVRDDHVRLGAEAPQFSAYKDLDAAVEKALVDWRKFQAEGQVRLRERRFKPSDEPTDAVFHDSDPFEVLVKQRALGEKGIGLFEYDELRGVLRRAMLRENAAKGILERAKARAAREGIPLEEAVVAERADTAMREAVRNVEEFSTRPEFRGLPPETRLRAFEERMMLDDLPVMQDIQYSPYQVQAMRQAFEEQLGFSYDDKHMIARYFRGEFDAVPAGARRPNKGEFMVFDEAEGVNVNVVPRGHPKLVDVPFGARQRALSEDDEVRKILREWEANLTRGDSVDDVAATELRAPNVELGEDIGGRKFVSGELGEGATERRGAPAGRRQNAAAEARRSSRRNFAQSNGGTSGPVVTLRGKRKTIGWHPKAADAVFSRPPQGYRRFYHYASPERAEDLEAGRTMRGDSGQGADLLGHGLYMATGDDWGLGYNMVRVALDVSEEVKLQLYDTPAKLVADLQRYGLDLDHGWGTRLQKALQRDGFEGIELRDFNESWLDSFTGFRDRDAIRSLLYDQVVIWDGRRLARPVPEGRWQTHSDWFEARGTQFNGPDDFVEVVRPEEYRRWLWDQMQSSPEFRKALKDLRGKQIVHSDGIKAQILADAADWMWTDDAAKRFADARPHPARPTAETTATEGKSAAVLREEEIAKYQEALRTARQLAGDEFRVGVRRQWLVDARNAIRDLGRRRSSDTYYHKAGDMKEIDRALVYVESLLERIGDSTGTLEVAMKDVARLDPFIEEARDFTLGLSPRSKAARLRAAQDPPKPGSRAAENRKKFEENLAARDERRPGASYADVETMGEILDRRGAPTRWLTGAEDGLARRRVEALEQKLAELRAGRPRRHRGLSGLSVHGDGVYVAEGTSNVTVAHELFHQFWDNEFNTAWRAEIEDAINLMDPALRSHLWNRIRIGKAAFDEAEFAAELFALWRVGDHAGSDVFFDWPGLRSLYQGDELRALDHLGEVFGSHAPRVVDTLRPQLQYPPLQHRGMLMQWMQDNGYFSPRTAEAIRAGERVWSVGEERKLFRSLFGAEPAWTDETLLKPILNDPRLHAVMLRQWGFFDDDFEQAAAAADLTPKQLTDALVWGKAGFPRQRTYAEMRDWAMQRYGRLVSDDGTNMTRMPWLMRPDDEYLQWTREFVESAGHQSDLVAARELLPEGVEKRLFEGNGLSRAGMEIDPSLVKGKELEKLRDAITGATERRIQRLIKAGDTEPGEWLAQEQLRFAYDVTDQLLADPVWRGWLRGTPVAGALLRVWGQLWRLLVSWQPAFPIMNLIDSFGMKRLLLTVYEGGMTPLSLEREGRRLVPTLRSIGAESASIFGQSGGSPWLRAADGSFTPFQRGKAVAQGVKELPVTISRFGEDRLRLDFARRAAGQTFRAARETGMSVENAEWLARQESKRLIERFFAMSHGESWRRVLDELVPFFSYNFKTKTFALQMMLNHPSVWVWGERLRREMEAANREQWEKDHPGLPFPDGDSNSWLWWKVGEDTYKIDLSAFSDWTRAMASVMDPHTPLEWFNEFIRIPHPSQLGALAMFTGGQTPWGNPGHIREMSIWADLFYWTRGIDYSDPRKQRDALQMVSQLLFFKKFGKIGAMDVKQSTYFALQQHSQELASQYLEANPDLVAYWESLPSRPDIKGFGAKSNFRRQLTDAEEAEYDAAIEQFEALNDTLDARIALHAHDPSSEAYRLAKREAHIARTVFLRNNPILTSVWGSFMQPSEFAEFNQRMVVDELADAWFNWKRPVKADFDSDLAYQRALVDFNERRAAFLDAHPALMDRISEGRTAIETAWKEQELHWTEVLDFQARLKIRILEEEARGDDADPDLVDLLYRARDFASADLDADRFGMFDSPNREGQSFFASLPGFADIRYARASDTEKKQIKADEAYFRTLKEISSKATSGKDWYDRARQNPGFLAEYWRRNPDKKAEYDANQAYIGYMGSWVGKLQARDFAGAQAVWDSMPAWVKERYFAKHPDSKMRDGMGGGGTAVQYKGRWFKSAESRDRYIKYIEGGGDPDGFVEADGQFFRSADSRQRFLDGQAYFASISRWVDLLKAKEFEAADKHFRSMPAWMQEKYYSKHPEQRARAQLDSDALRRGAEYFLASGDDKLRVLAENPQLRAWLKENGGDEAAMRGLINAMYRAIPSSEPWLKRTFRERFPEIFSQEAAGERRIEKVARELAEHPEMLPFFERALKLQSQLFMEQLKRNKTTPKPWTMERKKRAKKRSKRRAARMHSTWTLHRDIRKGY